jgi:glutathione synthetase
MHARARLRALNVVWVSDTDRSTDRMRLTHTSHTPRTTPLLRLQLEQHATLAGDSRRLLLPTSASGTARPRPAEASVVYYRAGYQPEDYPSEREWAARLLVERSRAIKCPSIAYHLVGAKKVQQALAQEGVLERFVPDASASAALRRSFAGLYGLEPEAAAAIRERVFAAPHRYVMKPQREGGGNNLYGAEVTAAMRDMSADELASHILMERIFPKKQHAILVRGGRPLAADAVGELGIYGVVLATGEGEGGGMLLNECAGHLLRTKIENVDEGGVASGYAVLSSPILL